LKKYELKPYTNTYKNQESHILKLILIDKNRDEISAVFFGDDAEFSNENIQEGKVYGFGKGSIKKANPKFNW